MSANARTLSAAEHEFAPVKARPLPSRRLTWTCVVLLVVACASSPDGAHADDQTNEIPSITVIANRQDENLQNVPMAISVVSGATALQIGITDPQSLAATVPGLLFNRSANLSIPYLRGIGSSVGESGDEPAIAYYVDDVYMPAASSTLANFTSLDRIEVEKGPQGTVFGRNATGGVVQVFTRNPTADPELDLTAGYANYATPSGSLYATGALGETLRANISLEGYDQNNGWGRYVVTGAEAFTGWEYGGRAKLLWTPTGGTSALLTVDYDDLRSEEGLNFRAFPGTGTLNPLPPFPNGGFPPPAGYYDNNQNWSSHTITRQSGVSLKLDSDFAWARLVNITAWRFTKAVDGLDEDAGPLPIVNATITTPEQTWTEEVRLVSPTGSATSWLVGAFYYHDVAGYMPLRFSGDAFAPASYVDSFTRETTASWSGFAQARREILLGTALTLGVRDTTDLRKIEADSVTDGSSAVPASNSPQSASWSKPTYRAVLDHHFTEDVMTYFGYNRGFKSGLFNPVILPGAPIGPAVAPEVLDAYTLGLKSELMGHRLRVNSEAFYYKDRDVQVQEIIGATTYITNAAAATIKGIDIDLTVIPLPRLTVTTSIEALTGTYTSFPKGLFSVYNPGTGGNCVFVSAGSCPVGALPPNYDPATGSWNLKGNHTVQTPPFSSNLLVQYDIPIALGQVALTFGWTHTGDYFADVDNGLGQVAPSSPHNDEQSTINLLSASTGWTSGDQRWRVVAWGKNLTGVKYWAFATEDTFATQFTAAPPRTFGITVGRHW